MQDSYHIYPILETPRLEGMLRRSEVTRWPYGVLSGGIVIDMLECLSTTSRTSDYAIVLWLQAHYIEPFGRIERLDGLVVEEDEDL
jgi:hypothetical protein